MTEYNPILVQHV